MKIGMVFPGYGSQFVGMGKELYDESRVVQEYFEDASNCLNMNFVKLCFASSDAELAKMSNAYVSLFLVSSAFAALLKEEGIEPQVVAGYNLGEYSAVHAVGGFSFPDGLYLLNKFALFYQEMLGTVDVAVVRVKGMPTEKLQKFCDEAGDGQLQVAFIGIYETADQHVVTGTRQALEKLRDELSGIHEVTINDLDIEVGLHSPLMDGVANQFKIYLEKVDFKDLRAPLITNVTAQTIAQGEEVKTNVVEHIHRPLLWHNVMTTLSDCELLVEVGPGTTLTNYLKNMYPEKAVISINKRADFDELHALVNQFKQ
jgi:[acyl-carrier-protein] S-malonyltransferase